MAGRLLKEGLPIAVIAATIRAPSASSAFWSERDAPYQEDVSVVGYDDARFSRIPGSDLTSVRQNIPKLAKLAVEAVVDRLDRPDRKPTSRSLRPKPAVRATAGPQMRRN